MRWLYSALGATLAGLAVAGTLVAQGYGVHYERGGGRAADHSYPAVVFGEAVLQAAVKDVFVLSGAGQALPDWRPPGGGPAPARPAAPAEPPGGMELALALARDAAADRGPLAGAAPPAAPPARLAQDLQACAGCHTAPAARGDFTIFSAPGVLDPGLAWDRASARARDEQRPMPPRGPRLGAQALARLALQAAAVQGSKP